MNATDRKRLGRLYSCLAKLPWPNRNRTLGPEDLSRFFYRVERLQRLYMRAVSAISRCDVEDPDEELVELERVLMDMGVRGPWEEEVSKS